MSGVLIVIYFVGLAVWLFGMWLYYSFNSKSAVTERRNLSRMAIIAPVWFLSVPALLIYSLKVIPWLWKKADWRNVQHDYESLDSEDYRRRADW